MSCHSYPRQIYGFCIELFKFCLIEIIPESSQNSRSEVNKLSVINKQSKTFHSYIWDKVFKNGPSKICRRQPLKN